MNNLTEAKAALVGCRCKSQIMAVVDAFCSCCRFSYSDDLSLMDNSVIASRQSKPKVANVLEFAAKQWEKL